MEYYKLKDTLGEYSYVYNDNTIKSHIFMFDKHNCSIILTDYSNYKKLETDIIDYELTLDELLELDYLEYHTISEKEYWGGIIDEYIHKLKTDIKDMIHSIKILKNNKAHNLLLSIDTEE